MRDPPAPPGRRTLLSLSAAVLTCPLAAPAAARGTAPRQPPPRRPAIRAPAPPSPERDRVRTLLALPVPRGVPWRLTAAATPPRLVLTVDAPPPAEPELPPPAPGLVRRITAAPAGPRATAWTILLASPVAAPVAAPEGDALLLALDPGPLGDFLFLADGRVLAAPPPTGPLPVVVLDPGHGGVDSGAVGAQGTPEKRITLAAALELRRLLDDAGRCRTVLTRAEDSFVPLAARIERARRQDAALFLSLHADSAPGARGASVYTLADTASDALAAALAARENAADAAFGPDLPPAPPEVQRILLSLMQQETRLGSERLARLVVGQFDGQVPLLANAHRHAGFHVLKAPDVPAALVEMGFLSDQRDEAALNRPAHRARLAAQLARSVLDFLAAEATPPGLLG